MDSHGGERCPCLIFARRRRSSIFWSGRSSSRRIVESGFRCWLRHEWIHCALMISRQKFVEQRYKLTQCPEVITFGRLWTSNSWLWGSDFELTHPHVQRMDQPCAIRKRLTFFKRAVVVFIVKSDLFRWFIRHHGSNPFPSITRVWTEPCKERLH